MKTIQIWEPRYHDMTVLISTRRVVKPKDTYAIEFTRTASEEFNNKRYIMTGEDIMSYPINTNGVIDCYAVPLADFEVRNVRG